MTEQLALGFDATPAPTPIPDRGRGRAISRAALDTLDLPRLEALVLEAIAAVPGSTMDALGTWLQREHRDASAWTCATLSGRLNGLGKRGLAFRRGTAPGRSGRQQARWWPRPGGVR